MNHHTSPESGVKDQTSERLNPAGGLDLTERCRMRLSPALQELLHTAAQIADAQREGVIGASKELPQLRVFLDGRSKVLVLDVLRCQAL